MTKYELVLRHARVDDGSDLGGLQDIGLEAGKIVAMANRLEDSGREERDLEGRVLLPGFVEAHCHIDKTLTIDRVENASGTLMEAIINWVAFKPQISRDDYLTRGRRALLMAMRMGTTNLRTHVDVDANGMLALEAMLELKQEFSGRVDMQIAALGGPSVNDAEFAAMKLALELGADIVGGCPAIRSVPKAEVVRALELAEQFGKPVDLHIDENENPGSLSLETLTEETIARGLEGRVTAGHCCSLAFVGESTVARVIEKVARARINIVTLPACNLVLQGREMNPTPRGLTRVKQLLEAGVNVVTGTDNVQDPFQPLGNYDLLAASHLTALAAHMTGRAQMLETLEMTTTRAAKVLGLEHHGVRVGCNADLVVIDAQSRLEALAQVSTNRMVIKAGKILHDFSQLK
jgi:cytosine/creatinine deaminase